MMDSCIQRCVKSNLFPMTEKQLTLEWAKDTYSSFHLFDNRVVSSVTVLKMNCINGSPRGSLS